MSAPTRNDALDKLFPPSERNTRYGWLAKFRRNVNENRTACKAWEMLVTAGLEKAALQVLWIYAHPPTDYIMKEQRKAQRANSQRKALLRAAKIVKQKAAVGDPRSNLFYKRYLQKYQDVLRSEMPFEEDNVKVGDWALSRSAAGKGIPDVLASRKMFALRRSP